MAFTFVTDKGPQQIDVPVKSEGKRAFRRALVEGFGGAYGNLGSFLPGYQPGRIHPGEKAISDLEARASDFDLAALAGDTDVAPPQATSPSSSQIDQLLEKFGYKKQENTPEEQFLGHFGRSLGGGLAIPGGGPEIAASTAFTGSLAKEGAKRAGLGPKGQNIAEFLAQLRLSGQGGAEALQRIRQPRVVTRNLHPREAGLISPERLTQQLNRVNREAASIAETVGQEHPLFQRISQSIERGHPIQQRFNQVFEGLENTAQRFNVPIDAAPFENFLNQELQRYAGTGAPTELGRFITSQIQGWQQTGQNNLYNMFRRYRLNNDRVREILADQSIPRNLKPQMIGFLTRMNQSIGESFNRSFEANLPRLQGTQNQSQAMEWLNAFRESNRGYSNYINTRQARSILDPIMHHNLTDQQLTRFLNNPNTWDDLGRFLGPDESGRLRTLLEDMQVARNGLQNIQQRDIGADILRHTFLSFIPGLGKFANLLSLPRVWQWARGRYNSGPEFQQNFHELAQALGEQNIPAINQAIQNFKEDKGKKKEKKTSFFVK